MIDLIDLEKKINSELTTKINRSEISVVYLDIGPGYYTSLRIGFAVAQGICGSLGIPLVPVNGLDALAFSAHTGHRTICTIIDIKRDEFVREIGFVNEAVKATVCRSLEYPHPMQEMIDMLMITSTATTEDIFASFDHEILEEMLKELSSDDDDDDDGGKTA